MWNNEVNDLLFVNYEKLTRVWNAMKKVTPTMRRGPEVKAVSVKKMLSMSNLCEVMLNSMPKLKLTERKVYQAFFLSKMTVANENEDGPKKYWNLEFVEFLEFICRVAWLVHQDTPMHN